MSNPEGRSAVGCVLKDQGPFGDCIDAMRSALSWHAARWEMDTDTMKTISDATGSSFHGTMHMLDQAVDFALEATGLTLEQWLEQGRIVLAQAQDVKLDGQS
jgi:hypothetical protein